MSEERVQRRLAAIVAIDVVGYSRLIGNDENGTLSALKTLRRELVNPIIDEWGGRIVKTTGDGLLLEFPSVVDATKCAVEMQTAMVQRNKGIPAELRMDFRVGVNLGDVIIDGDDILGDGVNVAARLESIAPPGGIAVSQDVFNSIVNKVDAAFVDVGEQSLKNIARPVRVFQWVPAGGRLSPSGGKAASTRPRAYVGWIVAAALVLAAGWSGYRWLPWAAWMSPSADTAAGAPVASPGQPPPVAEPMSIAVLPFSNQSDDAAQAYFSDGLTEDVITALGRFSSLKVIARNTAFAYKGRNGNTADVGRALAVRYIVEGSVRREDLKIRVSARLVEAASGRLLWSQRYDGSVTDVFAVQDEISHNVAGALAVKLTSAEQERVKEKPTSSLDAYDFVLRGREQYWRSQRSANRQAREYFNRSIAADPNYADAYGWLGRAYLELAEVGWTEDPNQAVERALQLGRKALAIDPDNVTGLSVIAATHAFRTEYDQALAASDRLLAINRSDADALFGRSFVLLWLGRIDEAVSTGETALRFEPNARVASIFHLGLAYYEARRHEDAVRVLEQGAARFPDNSYLYAVLAAAYAQLDRPAEAAKALATLMRLNPFFDARAFGSRFRNPAHHAYLTQGLLKAGAG